MANKFNKPMATAKYMKRILSKNGKRSNCSKWAKEMKRGFAVMHYYTKNIADFNNATRHLDRIERSVYLDLLELQYDLEEPIPDDLDWICKRVLASSEQERTSVERMLNEYFDLVQQGWTNGRAEKEISAYLSKKEKAIAAGKASGEARRRNKKPNKNNDKEHPLNERSAGVEPTNNQEPITTNQENITSEPPAGVPPCPHQEIINLFAEHCPLLTQPREWTETRRKHLQARWRSEKDRQDLDWWIRFFDYVSESSFLTGQTDKPFSCGLDWIVKPENFAKIIEGKYHGDQAA